MALWDAGTMTTGVARYPEFAIDRSMIYSPRSMWVMENEFNTCMMILWTAVICVFALEIMQILAHQ